jgi:hypothetical protein
LSCVDEISFEKELVSVCGKDCNCALLLDENRMERQVSIE